MPAADLPDQENELDELLIDALDGDDEHRAALILRLLWLEADQARTLKNIDKSA